MIKFSGQRVTLMSSKPIIFDSLLPLDSKWSVMTQSLVRNDSEQWLEALQRVLKTIHSQSSSEQLVETVTQYIQQHFDYGFVWLGAYSSLSQRLTGINTATSCPNVKLAQLTCPVLAGDLFDQVLMTRRAIAIPDLQAEARVGQWQKYASQLGIQGSVLVPVHFRKQPMGIMLLGSMHWGVNPRAEENQQLMILADAVGATLHTLEMENQAPKDSSSDLEILRQSMTALTATKTVDQSYGEMVAKVHQRFDPNITAFYRRDPMSGEFAPLCYQAKGERPGRSRKSLGNPLNIQPDSEFYRLLDTQQMIALSDAQSAIHSSVPAILNQQLQARAILCAGVRRQGRVEGWLVLGEPEPRNWTQEDKDFLAVVADILSLLPGNAADLSGPSNPQMAGKSTRAALLPSPNTSEVDWRRGLDGWLAQLCVQCGATSALLIKIDPVNRDFVLAHYVTHLRRTNLAPGQRFPALSDVDRRMLIRDEHTLVLSNLEEDLRLLAWREGLTLGGIKSVMLRRAAGNEDDQEWLLLGSDVPQSWSAEVSPILHEKLEDYRIALDQRQRQTRMLEQQHWHQGFSQGLFNLRQSATTQQLMSQAVQGISTLMQVPVVGIIAWKPGRTKGKVLACTGQELESVRLVEGLRVPLQEDPLIKELMVASAAAESVPVIRQLRGSHLAPVTQSWFMHAPEASILALPLQVSRDRALHGLVVIAAPEERSWSEEALDYLAQFVQQIAWMHGATSNQDFLRRDYQQLEALNWYKQRQVERSLRQQQEGYTLLGKILEQGSSSPQINRVPAILTEVNQHRVAADDLLKQESWQLDIKIESISLVRLLRESLDRLEPMTRARQLWTQVHHLTQKNLSVQSSKPHLEMVINEVLLAACFRSKSGGRIDIWCRALDQHWLDLSITDNGVLNPELVREFQFGDQRDLLKKSPLNDGVGRHLWVCQTLMRHLNGKLTLEILEDGRALSRLTLPLISQ
jgi:GAF domain-containing protein/signal transduction histidine kinase